MTIECTPTAYLSLSPHLVRPHLTNPLLVRLTSTFPCLRIAIEKKE